jgi:ADP-ribose pyrophosphatase
VRILRNKPVVENTRFTIRFDAVESAGFSVPDYLVVSPKVFNREGFSGVAILGIVDGKIALLRIHRPALGKDVWEIPRGFIDADEDTAVAACRELEEETGIQSGNEGLIPLGWVFPEAGVMDAKIAIFAVKVQQISGQRQPEIGLKSLEFLEPSRVLNMIDQSEIADPCTIAAIFRYIRRFGEME